MGPQILYCYQQPWLKVIKNTSWNDSQSVFLDNTSEKALAGRYYGETFMMLAFYCDTQLILCCAFRPYKHFI